MGLTVLAKIRGLRHDLNQVRSPLINKNSRLTYLALQGIVITDSVC